MESQRTRRPHGRAFLLATAVLASSCVDGRSPADVGSLEAVHLTAAPVFVGEVLAAEAAALDRARVTALHGSDGSVLGTVEKPLDPTASEWVIDLSFEVPADQPVPVRLRVELLGPEAVEWSGQTASFEVRGGGGAKEIRQVSLFRGPLDNLTVTRVELSGPDVLLTGETTSLSASLTGGGGGSKTFFESLDGSVATVDGAGRVRAMAAGVVRVVAWAGPASDTVSITVRDLVLPEDDPAIASVGPGLEETAGRITASMGDAAAAGAISDALSRLGAALDIRDGPEAVRAFEAARAAWAGYGAGTDLRLLDAPQLGLIEITLIHAADAIGIAFR